MITTWAHLDESNQASGHYGRGKPGWLLRAEAKVRNLNRCEINTIDAWEDGLVSESDVQLATAEREMAERELAHLRELWDGLIKSEGTHSYRVPECCPNRIAVERDSGSTRSKKYF